MTQLTLSLPDELATRLAARQAELPQIIECGLDRVETGAVAEFADLRDVLERLAALPTPEEVLQLRASPRLQARIGELLDKSRVSMLSVAEQRELEQIEFVEHLVRVAKGQAYVRLQAG
jgi:hypothetical protein